MRLVVSDASALLDYLLGTGAASRVRATVRIPDVDLHVPALCDVELASGLRRATIGRALSDQRAGEALEDYLDLPLTRHGHTSLMARIFELRDNFSSYDATYVALAESIGAELLTSDGRLARAVKTHTTVSIIG
ncbi:MAG TPA: type II toxin-antitoxin system VapC family toxin [Actinomycetota bacterium]